MIKNRVVVCILALLILASVVLVPSTNVRAFHTPPCHDDTSISRTNSHGSPLNGTFGRIGATANHSNGYYYLNISTGPGCVASQDGYVHLLGMVTANGIGLLPGHPICSTTSWGPPCYPASRRIVDPALASEDPTWGFEIKDAITGKDVACTGGDGSGGSDCPGTPNLSAVPGDATVQFRFDRAQPNHGYRFRLANEYTDNGLTDVMWETATFDVVACATCEP
jgi:hypothetical protein